MIDLCKLIWCALLGSSGPAQLSKRKFSAPPPTECAPPQVSGPIGLLQHRPAGVCRHIRAGSQHCGRAEDRQTRDRAPLASRRVASLLALESSIAGRATEFSAEIRDLICKMSIANPLWGAPSHPRRIAQARHRCWADHRCKVHGQDQAPTLAGLEDLPSLIMPMASPRWTCSSCRRSRFGCYTGF